MLSITCIYSPQGKESWESTKDLRGDTTLDFDLRAQNATPHASAGFPVPVTHTGPLPASQLGGPDSSSWSNWECTCYKSVHLRNKSILLSPSLISLPSQYTRIQPQATKAPPTSSLLSLKGHKVPSGWAPCSIPKLQCKLLSSQPPDTRAIAQSSSFPRPVLLKLAFLPVFCTKSAPQPPTPPTAFLFLI
jgi:hypothetical protein